MFSKTFRLKSKDINFLVKKRKYYSFGYFGFFYYKQYSNFDFNQISINIPLKYSKKAVTRNHIKRVVLSYLQKNKIEKKRIKGGYYKIFINLNKKQLGILKSQIKKFDKKELNQYILSEFEKSFLNFLKRLGK